MADKTIDINLQAGTASFTKPVDEAGIAAERMGRKVHEATPFLEKFKEGFSIGAGIEAARASIDAFEAPFEAFKHGLEETGDIARNALKNGMSVEDMSRFQYAASATYTDVGTLTAAMTRLDEEIGKVASGAGGPAAEALKTLGLDARQLAQQDPAATFKQVSAAVAGMTSQYERAHVMHDLMGRSAKDLEPVLEHLNELLDESDQIGFTRTAEQAKAAEEAERSLAKATGEWKALMMDVSTSDFGKAVFESVEDIAKEWRDMFDQGSRTSALQDDVKQFDAMKQKIKDITAAKNEAAAAGDVNAEADAQGKLVALMKQRVDLAGRIRANEAATGAAVQLGDGTLQGYMRAEKSAEDTLGTLNDQVTAQKAIADAAAATATADQKRWEANEKLVETLEKQARQAGMTPRDKEIDDAAHAGLNDDQTKRAIDAIATKDAAEKHAELAREAKRSWEAAETPLQRYNDKIVQLNDELAEHLLTMEQYEQIKQKLTDDLNKEEDKGLGKTLKDDLDRLAPLLSRQFDFHLAGNTAFNHPAARNQADGEHFASHEALAMKHNKPASLASQMPASSNGGSDQNGLLSKLVLIAERQGRQVSDMWNWLNMIWQIQTATQHPTILNIPPS